MSNKLPKLEFSHLQLWDSQTLELKTQMKDFKTAEPTQKMKDYGVRQAQETSAVTETYDE